MGHTTPPLVRGALLGYRVGSAHSSARCLSKRDTVIFAERIKSHNGQAALRDQTNERKILVLRLAVPESLCSSPELPLDLILLRTGQRGHLVDVRLGWNAVGKHGLA